MDSPRAVFKCTELGCENDALRLSEGIKCREHLVDRAGKCEKAARKVQEAMDQQPDYLGIDCPLCDRRRLLVCSDRIECEKCEMKWDEPQSVALQYRRDAFAEAAVAVRALKLVGPAPLANLEGWCPTLEAAALAVEAQGKRS